MEIRSVHSVLAVLGLGMMAIAAPVEAKGPNHHGPVTPPPASVPRDRTEAAFLLPGDEFSVASDFDYGFPLAPGNHFHSDNGRFQEGIGPDLMEVGGLCDPQTESCEEIRGLVEFDLSEGFPVDSANLVVEVLQEGGLFDQFGPGEFTIEVFAFEGNGEEEISDYDIGTLELVAEFASFDYEEGEFISIDVTELWNESVELGLQNLGFRFQAAFDPFGAAMVFGNAGIELFTNTSPPPLSVSLGVSPRTVEQGEPATVTWESTGADGCEASGGLPGWEGDKDLSGSQVFSTQQVGRYSFRIRCNQFIVSLSRTAFLDVIAAAPEPGPTVELSASSTSVGLGDRFELTWTAEDAVSCQATGGLDGFNGPRDLVGSDLIDADVAGLAKFTLRCVDGEGLSDADTVSVQVNGSNPDLVINSFSLTRDEQDVGGPVGFNLRVGNQGDGASGPTTVRYFLSENAVITPSDTFVGSVDLGAVAVGGSVSPSGLNIAAPVTAGRFWLGGCINAAPGETNLQNNCTPAVPITVTANVACAEEVTECGAVLGGGLSIQDCQGGPRGAGFPASKQMINLGEGQELTFDAEWFEGMDGFLSLQAPDGGPFVASNDDFGGTDRSRLEFVADEAGEYTLWVTSFEPGASGGFEVTTTCGAGAPDLVPSFVAAPATALVDELVALEFEVENRGEASSGGGVLTLRLSPDSELTPEDAFSSDTGISGLGAGGSIGHTFSGRFREPGNYWMGACYEETGSDELFTANNCSAAQLVEVRNPSDCAVGSLQIGQVTSGEVLEEDCDAGPRGTGYPTRGHTFNGSKGQVIAVEASWESWDGYLYVEGPDGRIVAQADDADGGFFATPEGSNVSVRTGPSKGKGPDDARTENGEEQTSLTVELPSNGTYTVWMTGFEPRSKGGYEVSAAEVLSSPPQYESEGLALSQASVAAGGQAVATLALRDLSDNEDYQVEVFYYLSSNNTLSAEDSLFAQRLSAPFGSGERTEVKAFVPVPQSPGNYWVGACPRNAGDDSGVSVGGNCDIMPLEVTSTAERIAFNPGLNDTWFEPETSGQGFFVEVFQDIGSVFLTWFTYETDGAPLTVSANIGDEGHRWFTAQGDYDETGVDLDVTVTRGGLFDSDQAVSRTTDGTMRLEFLGCDAGVLTYDIPSENSGRLQGTIPIQRVAKDNVFLCERFLEDAAEAPATPLLAASRTELRAGESASVVWRAPEGMQCRPDGSSPTSSPWKSARLDGSEGLLRLPPLAPGEHRLKMKCKDGLGQSASAEAVIRVSDLDSGTENTGPEIVVNEGLNDAWVDPDANGQGLLVNVFPELNAVFAAWFTFDNFDPGSAGANIGAPGHRWVTAFGPVIGNEAEMDITLTRGGAFDQRNPRPENVNGYGTLNLSFDSCDAITADYDIPSAGESGTLNLRRVTQDRVPNCVTKSGTGNDEGRLVAPDDKQRIDNACNGSLDWEFQWEDSPLYDTYQIQVRQESDEQPRVDESVQTNRYRLTKNNAIPETQLDGWTWRVRGVISYPRFVVLGDWSEYEFSVRPLSQCN